MVDKSTLRLADHHLQNKRIMLTYAHMVTLHCRGHNRSMSSILIRAEQRLACNDIILRNGKEDRDGVLFPQDDEVKLVWQKMAQTTAENVFTISYIQLPSLQSLADYKEKFIIHETGPQLPWNNCGQLFNESSEETRG